MKLRRETQKHIEAELHDYKATLSTLAHARERTKGKGHPDIPEHPRGGLLMPVSPDRQTQEMKRITDAIQLVYDKSTTTHQKLIVLKYWQQPKVLSWDNIAAEIHVSRRQVFKLRGHILQAIAQQLGWH